MPINLYLGYPSTWPNPGQRRVQESFATRVTEEEKIALYERKLTGRALAKRYGVTESHVSVVFPGRKPLPNKAARSKAIKLRRVFHAKRVLLGEISITEAAKACFTSYSTMRRAVIKLSPAFEAERAALSAAEQERLRAELDAMDDFSDLGDENEHEPSDPSTQTPEIPED